MSLKFKKYLEISLISIIIFVAVYISKYPTLHNFINTPPDLFFTRQVVWFDTWDVNAYVSYIRYGQKNGVLLQNTYTTVPHRSVFVFQTYTLLGVLNRILKIDPFLLFHLAAIIAGISLLLVIYFALIIFIPDLLNRITAFSIITLGAGLGWITNLQSSADYSLAGFTLVDPLERPHNALTTLFIIGQVAFLVQFISKGRTKYLFFSLLSSFLSFTIHPPLGLLSVLVYLAAFAQFNKLINPKIYLRYSSVLLSGYLLYFMFFLKDFLFNPGFKNTGEVGWIPDLIIYIRGFGILTAGIILSFFSKNQNPKIKLLSAVFVIQMVLSFIPFGFHMYYVKGIFVWGVILAVYGLSRSVPVKLLPYLLVFLILFSLPLRIKIFNLLQNADRRIQYFYLDKKEGDALYFMSLLPSDSSVLSLYRLGNVIPAFTDNRVYLGHRFQTPDFAQKIKEAEKFYLTDNYEYQKNLIRDNKIEYVYVGLEEQLLRKNNKLLPFKAPDFLKPVFQKDFITVYQVF